MKQQPGLIALITLALGGLIGWAGAQQKDEAPVKYKMTTPIPPVGFEADHPVRLRTLVFPILPRVAGFQPVQPRLAPSRHFAPLESADPPDIHALDIRTGSWCRT
jgi:hypothetical protein